MQTSLWGIAEKARTHKKHRFQNLYRELNEELLHQCWMEIRKDAAYGVDRVSAEEYEEELTRNIRDLVERLKRKRYRAKLVRRHYIPKENGKVRPLGIPAVEDKLLQLAAAKIIESIYEGDFLECSYGYRPRRGVHDAVEALSKELHFGGYQWVVEADIQGYFDNIDHDWMIRMLSQRVDDQAFLRLIKKWLKAGVLDTNGKVLHPMTGTPQGGIVSPVLSNVYLHYVLDLWFEKIVKRHIRGKAILIRYADDFVCAFDQENDAKAFREVLGKRLEKFGLALSEEKTRVIRFSRNDDEGNRFDFLGFEYWWGRNRKGNASLKRRTSRKKLRSALKRFNAWCKEHRHLKLEQMFSKLRVKLMGYYNHYGIIGNFRSLMEFFYHAERMLVGWLNRRSQKRSITWERYRELKKRYALPGPRLASKLKRVQLSMRF